MKPGGTKSLPLSLHVWENAYSLFLTTMAIVMDVRELQALLNAFSSTHDWEILTKSILIPNGWIPMAYAQLSELTAQEIPVSILFPPSSFLMTVYGWHWNDEYSLIFTKPCTSQIETNQDNGNDWANDLYQLGNFVSIFCLKFLSVVSLNNKNWSLLLFSFTIDAGGC